MTWHFRTQHPHRSQRTRLDAQQRRIIRHQAILIAQRRAIIRLQRQARRGIGFRSRVRSDGHISSDDSLSGSVAHTVGPEVVHVPGLGELRDGSVAARGDEVDEYVVHGRC